MTTTISTGVIAFDSAASISGNLDYRTAVPFTNETERVRFIYNSEKEREKSIRSQIRELLNQ